MLEVSYGFILAHWYMHTYLKPVLLGIGSLAFFKIEHNDTGQLKKPWYKQNFEENSDFPRNGQERHKVGQKSCFLYFL